MYACVRRFKFAQSALYVPNVVHFASVYLTNMNCVFNTTT